VRTAGLGLTQFQSLGIIIFIGNFGADGDKARPEGRKVGSGGVTKKKGPSSKRRKKRELRGFSPANTKATGLSTVAKLTFILDDSVVTERRAVRRWDGRGKFQREKKGKICPLKNPSRFFKSDP